LSTPVYLVVTDLDGSLLDHHTYSYEAAQPALDLLEQLRIPLILASSKTWAEMASLRDALGNEHPAIVENGAAVRIPRGYFPHQPPDCIERDGYLLREFAPPRGAWAPLVEALHERFPGRFMDFATASVDDVMQMTGLTPTQAALAKEREYSEPIEWRGDESELPAFLEALRAGGARPQRGGRFISLAGDSDKGAAWRWLRACYAVAAGGVPVYDLGLGDGQNDVPLLETTHRAVVIPAPERGAPDLAREAGILAVTGIGPEAWAQGVGAWLRELYTGNATHRIDDR